MIQCDEMLSRRAMLGKSVNLLAALAAIPVVVCGTPALASKASKGDFHYQDQPKNGHRCTDCAAFTPDSNQPAMGTCKVVDGVISADGWCMAYSGK